MTTQRIPSCDHQVIDRTAQVIEARKLRYRALVITVSMVVLGCLAVSIANASFLGLLGLCLLVPLSGVFWLLDACLVNRWRHRILDVWVQNQFDLAIFRETMTAIRMLPAETLAAMLDTLPPVEKGATLSRPTKKALAETVETIGRCQSNHTAFVTLGTTVALGGLGLSVALWSPLPLVSLAGLPLVIAAGRGDRAIRLRRWRRLILDYQDSLEIEHFLKTAKALDWDPIPECTKTQLLNSIGTASPV